jgi:hypothetical protein
LLFEEEANAIAAELLAVLEEQALMNALLRVLGFPFALCGEGGDQQGVGCAGDVHVAVVLDELEGFLVVPERDLGEFF